MVPNGLCLKISTRAAMRVTISIVGAAAVCMSGTAIAADSGEKTVKSLMGDILHKLGVPSRTQAALYALRTGLVSLDETALN